MARRDLEEINAGSMADIAFLLLVFFLVVTTMNNDQGLSRLLPPPLPDTPIDPPEFYDRDVYEVLVNFNNDLLVEGNPMNVGSLRAGAREFLIANGDNVLEPLREATNDLPHRRVLNRDSVMGEILRKETELEVLKENQEKAIESNEIDKLSEIEKAIKVNKVLWTNLLQLNMHLNFSLDMLHFPEVL